MTPETKSHLKSIVQDKVNLLKEEDIALEKAEINIHNIIDTFKSHKIIFEEILKPFLPKGKLKFVIKSKKFKQTKLEVYVETALFKTDIFVIRLCLSNNVPCLNGVKIYNLKEEIIFKMFVEAVLVELNIPGDYKFFTRQLYSQCGLPKGRYFCC